MAILHRVITHQLAFLQLAGLDLALVWQVCSLHLLGPPSHGAGLVPLFMAGPPAKYNWQFRSSPQPPLPLSCSFLFSEVRLRSNLESVQMVQGEASLQL